MSLTTNMVATYRGPGAVMHRLLTAPESEARALAFLMGACALVFVSQWPRMAREAHLQENEIDGLLAGALMAWIFIAPLLFYAIALLSGLVLRVIGLRLSGYATRMALFWSLLASVPLIILNGLVAGFIGPGLEQTFVGALWFGVFLWFWIGSLREAVRLEAP